MLDLEQCPFCNGKLEIATLNCPSGGTPCYCFRCTKCGGIRRFGTLNPADICRECELSSRNRELEAENVSLRQAGHRLAMLICDIVLDKKIDEEAMRYAIAKWSKARDKEEDRANYWIQVDPTVEQFIGLTDKHSKKMIFYERSMLL